MYDITAVANRLTLAVHAAITHHSKVNSGDHVLEGSSLITP